MSFNHWLRNLGTALAPGPGQCNRGQRGSLQAVRHWPSFEVLEDRCLLSFSPVTSFPVGLSPSTVVTADFNNDGQFDLATLNENTISVLLGGGDGTFLSPLTSSSPDAYFFSQTVAVGDFNADSNLDLATPGNSQNGLGVSILLGNGDGTFAPAVPQAVWPGYGYDPFIAIGDLNADEKPDLVETFHFEGAFDVFVSARVLLGQGDGSFAPAGGQYFDFYDDVWISTPVLADFDGDENVDVAVVVENSVMLFLGKGNGFLQSPMKIATDSGALYLAVGDFNADGSPDLAATNYVSSVESDIIIMLGNGDGTFQAEQSFAAGAVAGGNTPYLQTVGDINGDVVPDLVVTSAGGVSVLLGNGDGSFSPPIMTATGSDPYSVVLADFNGDGRPDVAAPNFYLNTVSVLLNSGDWGPNPLPGDYNNNGTVDAADYSVWRDALGSHVANYSGADGNGNGVVDTADYDIWRSHFGMTLPEPTAGSGAAAPTSSAVAILIQEPAAIEEAPAEPTSASAKSNPTAERAAGFAVLEPPTRWQDFGSRSRRPIGHFRVNKVGGDDLLLLAIDRAGRSPQRDFGKSRDNGNDEPRADKGHCRNLIDEPLAVAIAPSTDLVEVFAHDPLKRSYR